MSERGLALFMVLVVTAFLSALTLGTVLAVFMDRLASGNTKGSVGMLYAADAGIEIAARDLAEIVDWNPVLAGTQQGTFVDGTPGGVRTFAGRDLDLTALTNALNCGRASNCTASQMNANSAERPWGTNNPRWRLFAYGPFGNLPQFVRPVPCYLLVWIADDSREQDGNPAADAVNEDDPGHGIVRVHAETFGRGGARRTIEAELVRTCIGQQGSACPVGIRVQSWLELRQVVP
jgi:hypothetical protein